MKNKHPRFYLTITIMLPSFGESTMEILSNGFIYFFFTGKFFVLFSLLFGLFGEIEVWQGILTTLILNINFIFSLNIKVTQYSAPLVHFSKFLTG